MGVASLAFRRPPSPSSSHHSQVRRARFSPPPHAEPSDPAALTAAPADSCDSRRHVGTRPPWGVPRPTDEDCSGRERSFEPTRQSFFGFAADASRMGRERSPEPTHRLSGRPPLWGPGGRACPLWPTLRPPISLPPAWPSTRACDTAAVADPRVRLFLVSRHPQVAGTLVLHDHAPSVALGAAAVGSDQALSVGFTPSMIGSQGAVFDLGVLRGGFSSSQQIDYHGTEIIKQQGFAALPRSVLILFSGPAGRDDGLAASIRREGLTAVEVDVLIGGQHHDLSRAGVANQVLADIAAGSYCAVFAAPPCSSFSIAHDPPLRSRGDVRGESTAPAEWRAYLDKHNRLADFTAAALAAAHAVGSLWLAENPADRSDADSPAYWHAYADSGSFWRMPAIVRLRSESNAAVATFAQCQLGAPAQKWTTLFGSPRMAHQLTPFRRLRCVCRSHAAYAFGYDASGTSLSRASAAYPRQMNELLGAAIAAAARANDLITERGGSGGGRVRDGPQLCAPVRAAIEAARTAAPFFGSPRRRLALTTAEVAALPFPPGPHEPMRTRAPRPRRKSGCPLPAEGSGAAAAPASARPRGDVHISQLFLGDIYVRRIEPWLALAGAAMADIRAGRTPRPVRTEVVRQEEMQPWARGVVWDTRDPLRCSPVRRSTADSHFAGRRQVDRAAVRRAATAIAWHDEDIVDQVCGGGLEARSGCDLTTVLAFHHQGLAEHVARVDAIIHAELDEEWLSAPLLTLPFVPSRVLPRNVIMQDRVRVDAQGRAEHYQKPRITTDASDGGDESPNAGVSFHERTVSLTTVHELATAAAIVDSSTVPHHPAEGGDRVRAGLFAVDLEAAFRFLPLQVADLWTQVLLWDVGGSPGYIVDHRLCFGGAYAVNRFQRFSLLYTAWSQAQIAAFDAAYPPPRAIEPWVARRRELQQRGALPPGDSQLQPRYSKPYIDDATGVALCDEVTVPAALTSIALPTVPLEPGALVASHTCRLAVHCRYFISVAFEFGLSVQPKKVQLGDPIVALGFAVAVRDARVRCPEPKRDALVAQLREFAVGAAETPPAPVPRDRVARLTGRLLNLSQTAPDITPLLHAGYSLSSTSHERRRLKMVQLSAGSRAHDAWRNLIDVALFVLEDNTGVPLAPVQAFPPRDAPGVLTVVTDASGDDGFGGWAFFASDPGTLYVVSEEWPEYALDALRRGKAPRSSRDPGPTLSMPAAEVFAAVAVAAAVHRCAPVDAVIAIGDCRPASSVLSGARSPNAQMRVVGGPGEDVPRHVLGVHVVRELNLDADRTSHPQLVDDVVREAREAGWSRVVRLRGDAIPHATWQRLRSTVAVGGGRTPERPRPEP